jgi:hypothetical protein
MTTALLDRLTHRCHLLKIGNDSFGFQASSAEMARKKMNASNALTLVSTKKHNLEVAHFSVENVAHFCFEMNTHPLNSAVLTIKNTFPTIRKARHERC